MFNLHVGAGCPLFEPTCAHARWALMHWTILHISESIASRVIKFGQIQWSCESRLKVTWVKVNGHMGQSQPKAHDICRWAHINVKLLHYNVFFSCYIIPQNGGLNFGQNDNGTNGTS